jgi:hypothetical protein
MVQALEVDAPPIDPTLEWIWRAWHRLSDDRPHFGGGMGPPIPGRIPWSVVHLWAEHHELQKGEMDMLDLCLGQMDVVYLEWWRSIQPPPARP